MPRPQTPQIVVPTAPLYLPAGHSLHRVEASRSWSYVPGRQVAQMLPLINVQSVPAAQQEGGLELPRDGNVPVPPPGSAHFALNARHSFHPRLFTRYALHVILLCFCTITCLGAACCPLYHFLLILR